MSLRVVQVNCVIDGERREPDALLDAWPTLPAVAEATAAAGADVIILVASHRAAVVSRNGIAYRFVAEPRLRAGSGPGLLPWRLAAAVRRERPDAVHFNGFDFPLHARAVCGTGVPVLVQDHKSGAGGRMAGFRRWGYARIAGAAFTAVGQAEPFRKHGQIPLEARVFAIPESSTPFRAGSRAEARSATGLSGDPALLWVGHLDANKDPLTILEAMRAALPALPGLRLWCAYATAPLMPEVERMLAADPALAGRVHLLGRLPHDRIELLCRAADFFVLGSGREGSGYALLEALACGATPIVSDIPPFRELTGNGAVGSLAPRGDPTAFADAIVRLAALPRESLRERSLDHFRSRLSFEVVGRKLVQAYRTVAAAGPG
ncbi:MAG TPA: glycosyltransferase family 4 protein [Allosphingosinicella sp.]|nr:glycosyltransferase family 4 protein [Allosphingosinicella sp.]